MERLCLGLLLTLAVIAVARAHYGSKGRKVDSARTAADMDLIEFEIKNLNRPHMLLDNSVLVQEVDAEAELTKYRWMTIRPGDRDRDRDMDVSREHKSRVVLKRPGIEVGQNVIIFNSGKHAGFGPATNRAYVVLRKYEKVAHPHTYLVNLVYIWHIGTRQEIHIEWSSFDEVDYLALNTDNKIERALCRNEDCDFSQWIFGTCEIISRDCAEVLASRDNEMAFTEESDENEDDYNGNGKIGSREDSDDWSSFARKVRKNSRRARKGRGRSRYRDSDRDDSKEDEDKRFKTRIVGPGIRVRVPVRDKDRHSDKDKDKGSDEDKDKDDGSGSSSKEGKRSWWKFWKKGKKKTEERRNYGRRRYKNDHGHDRRSGESRRGRDHDRDRDRDRNTEYDHKPQIKIPTNIYKKLEDDLVNDAMKNSSVGRAMTSPNMQFKLDMLSRQSDVPMHWEPDGHVLRQRRQVAAAAGGGGRRGQPANYYQLLRQIQDQQKQARSPGGGDKPRPVGGAGAAPQSPLQAGLPNDPQQTLQMVKMTADAMNSALVDLNNRVQLPDGGTELGFKNEVLDKSDRVRESLLDVELRQICYDCQSIGNFYDEYLEEARNSKKIGRILKKQRRSRRWSWTRTHTNAPLGADRVVPFIGFGDCGEHQLLALPKSPRHPKTAQLDDVIEFYVETLRVQCKAELIDELRSWLTTKLNFTHVQPDLTLGLMPTSLIMKYNLLSKDEYEMLFSAALLSQYTMRFVEETNLGLSNGKAASTKEKNDQAVQRQQRLSPRTAFLKRLTLRFLTYIQYNIPQHYVKLTRSVIQLLLDKFHTLLAERVELLRSSRRVSRLGFERAKEHSKRIALNYNDLQQIMGLKEYIIFGIEPSLKSGVANKEAFTSFYALNEQRMKFLVDSYRTHA